MKYSIVEPHEVKYPRPNIPYIGRLAGQIVIVGQTYIIRMNDGATFNMAETVANVLPALAGTTLTLTQEWK